MSTSMAMLKSMLVDVNVNVGVITLRRIVQMSRSTSSMYGSIDHLMERCIDGFKDRWSDGSMAGSIDRYINRLMDGSID